MEYRGFKIKPEFDGAIYFGKLEGLGDLVTVEAQTLAEFEIEFKAAENSRRIHRQDNHQPLRRFFYWREQHEFSD